MLGVVAGVFVVMLFLGFPIATAMMLPTMLPTLTDATFAGNMGFLIRAVESGWDTTPTLAIPLFMLSGAIMANGGISKKLFDVFAFFFGKLKAGMPCCVVITCLFYGAISGSGPATVAAVGAMCIPILVNLGYDKLFSAAIVATAGGLGVIIPPSIPFVIYAVVTNQSVSDLFIAGILPGVLMGVALIVVCVIVSKKEGYQTTGKCPSLRDVWKSFKEAFWALMTPVIILGGIYSGTFTPTESAVIAVVYCVIVSVFVYKEFRLVDVYKSLYDSINVNGMTTFMVGFSMAFAAYLTMEKIPARIAAIILGVTDNRILLLLLINLLLLGVGCLIDNIPATIILSPILLPIVTNLGMTPIQFGIMLTMNLAIGFVTPPYGIDLFVASAISKEPMSRMIKPTLRFIFSLLVVLMLVTFCEPVTMGVLHLMGK